MTFCYNLTFSLHVDMVCNNFNFLCHHHFYLSIMIFYVILMINKCMNLSYVTKIWQRSEYSRTLYRILKYMCYLHTYSTQLYYYIYQISAAWLFILSQNVIILSSVSNLLNATVRHEDVKILTWLLFVKLLRNSVLWKALDVRIIALLLVLIASIVIICKWL